MATNSPVEAGVGILLGIIGLAGIALVVSGKSTSSGLIQAIGSAFSNSLGVAIAPVTGASYSISSGGSISSGSGTIGGIGGSGFGSLGAVSSTGGSGSGSNVLSSISKIPGLGNLAGGIGGFLTGSSTGAYIGSGALGSAYRSAGGIGLSPSIGSSNYLNGVTGSTLQAAGLYGA
jgi:hypothetical protein